VGEVWEGGWIGGGGVGISGGMEKSGGGGEISQGVET